MGEGRPTWIYRTLLESALIVFAVVLGFLVTEWRAEHRAQATARSAMERIVLELEANISSLERAQPYHVEVAQTVGARVAALQDGEAPTRGPFVQAAMESMPRGIGPPQLTRAAWDYAVSTGVLDPVDYAVVADLAAVYAGQDSGVQSTWRQIATLFLTPENMAETDLAPRFQLMGLMFAELASQEAYLIVVSRDARNRVCAWLEREVREDRCDLGDRG